MLKRFLILTVLIFSLATCRTESQIESRSEAPRTRPSQEFAPLDETSVEDDTSSEKSPTTLMSFNVFQKGCFNSNPDKEPLLEETFKGVDLVFTQEGGPIKKLGPMTLFDTYGTGAEVIELYQKESSTKEKKFSYQVTSHPSSSLVGVVKRHGAIAHIRGFTVANLHLSGGRYDDIYIRKNLSNPNNILIYKVYKLELLNEILKQKPDIILGDFNSVYAQDSETQESFYKSQYDYFVLLLKNQSLTEDEKAIIRDLNSAPFERLKEAGYTHAVPKNEKTSSSNARGRTIIDTIWYHAKKVAVSDVEIVEIFEKSVSSKEPHCPKGSNQSTGGLSDHNPVKATFTKKGRKAPSFSYGDIRP